VLGLGALPLVAIPHPLAGNNAELVGAKAHAIADEIAFALTADIDVLTTHYASRFRSLTERRLAHGAVCVDAVCAVDPALVARAAD
jgi:demethoxyubiquinone hydroxylase (CLK1/Coq7/Cat5 family)